MTAHLLGISPIFLTISANTNVYDIFTNAHAAAAARGIDLHVTRVDIILTVNTGVRIGGRVDGVRPNFTNVTAMTTGSSFVAGSTILLINKGNIYGPGGPGGNGGTWDSDGYPGFDGGDAINLGWDLTIDNTAGTIFSGGDGGDGGAGNGFDAFWLGGGGGGGGQGWPASVGGIGASGYGGRHAGNGHQGDTYGPGAGGAGIPGGDWAFGQYPPSFGGDPGRACGDGYAVKRNGRIVTWRGGYNGSQVKGLVA